VSPPRARGRYAFVLSVVILGSVALPGPASAAPPGNDDFAAAVVIPDPLPFSGSVSTEEATLEPDEPALGDTCGFRVGRTVWYRYTPTTDTFLSATTLGSTFDTVLGVWSGPDLATLSLVACNDDAGGLESNVSFLAEMGTQYNFQVGGFDRQSGQLDLTVREIGIAGAIEGTVTDDGTAQPLGGICVGVFDADFGSFVQGAVTLPDGTYQVTVRPGAYVLEFFDCSEDTYLTEWWDDAADRADATPITVFNGSVISGRDAALTAGCRGFASAGENHVVGTAGSDVLLGTPRRDVICGLGGDDILRGARHQDRLIGGIGDDILLGDEGRDRLDGGPGIDICHGGQDTDRARRCEELHSIP